MVAAVCPWCVLGCQGGREAGGPVRPGDSSLSHASKEIQHLEKWNRVKITSRLDTGNHACYAVMDQPCFSAVLVSCRGSLLPTESCRSGT